MRDVNDRRIGVVIALAVGSAWGFLSVLAFAQPDPFTPIRFIDYLAVVSFSVALAVLAPAAWLIARVAGGAFWRGLGGIIRGTAIILAVGGLMAGFGNLIEDGLQMKEVGGALFSIGLGGIFIGLLGMTFALALGGRWALAGLCAVTFGGMLASQQYASGLIVMAVWYAFAVWLWRGRSDPNDFRTGPDLEET